MLPLIPHSPCHAMRLTEAIVQQTNSNNCKLYEFTTAKYSQTLDKLEYIKAMVPELYQLFIDSLYARGVYDAFEWIKEWLEGRPPHPAPDPLPPVSLPVSLPVSGVWVLSPVSLPESEGVSVESFPVSVPESDPSEPGVVSILP